jgi:hypothetical protein
MRPLLERTVAAFTAPLSGGCVRLLHERPGAAITAALSGAGA